MARPAHAYRYACLHACLLALCLWPGAARAQSGSAVTAALGACGEPCVVRGNQGGDVQVFQAAAQALRAGARRKVVIDGPCYSSCVILADLARERVCITSRARFGFHKSTIVDVHPGGRVELVGRQDPPHSADIAGWVRAQGGFPVSGYRMMSAGQAAKFWRRC